MSRTPDEISQIVSDLNQLKIEHSDLDSVIQAQTEQSGNQLLIQRLKKRKLVLKDKIKTLENLLMPDIIA